MYECLNPGRRGYMFWSLKFEGKTPINSTTPLYLAAVLNAILHIR